MRLRRSLVGAGVILIAMSVIPKTGWTQTDAESLAFAGSASANGMQVTLNVPGFPATDIPVDSGGPTAQVAVNSLGSSTGYAAFPDPGGFLISLPGLGAGILAGGAAGLPPIRTPSPPSYPFFVQSDAQNAREQAVGSGPYSLSAMSEEGASEASSRAGFQSGVSGNTALVSSTASLHPTKSGGVEAKAVSNMQGFSFGPLTIAEVKSTAMQSVSAYGVITPRSELEIAGLRVGGVPFSVTPAGFVAGGHTEPMKINEQLKQVLSASKITIEIVAAQEFPGRVVAPALKISMPFAMPVGIPEVGQFSGTATMIMGFATAAMTVSSDGTSSEEEVGGAPLIVDDDAQASQEPEPISSGDPGAVDFGGVEGSDPRIPDAPGGFSHSETVAEGSGPMRGSPGAPEVQARGGLGGDNEGATGRIVTSDRPIADRLDLRSLNLLLVAGAVVLVGASQLVARVGSRS